MLTLVTTTDRGVVKGVEPSLVGPGVLGGVKTDLGGGVGGSLGQEGVAVEVHVPGGGADSDGGGTSEDSLRGPEGSLRLGHRRGEASLLWVSYVP